MSVFLGILAAAALAGGFTVYPWNSDSRSLTVIASVLWFAGVVMAIGTGVLENKGRKKPKDSGIVEPVDPRESLKTFLSMHTRRASLSASGRWWTT
jgi:hypothetical protein